MAQVVDSSAVTKHVESASCSSTHVQPSDNLKRAAVDIIRCRGSQCEPPVPLPHGRLRASTIATREAKLLWRTPIKHVLMVKKWKDETAKLLMAEIGEWIQKEFSAIVCTLVGEEHDVKKEDFPTFQILGEDMDIQHIDLIVAVGGDGTVLHISSLFSCAMPPVFSVAGGSLGFMTMFDVSDAKEHLQRVFQGTHEPISVSIRTRLSVDIYKAIDTAPSTTIERSSSTQPFSSNGRILDAHDTSQQIDRNMNEPSLNNVRYKHVAQRFCLNEVLVDRGQSPFLATLDAYVDDEPLTTVEADGILIATPSGSTAYSLSAGGSICLCTVPALLFTPICPHSLSFRPLLLPDSSAVKLVVPDDARASAWAHFDGRDSTELAHGDILVARMSEWPMPLINKINTTYDWIHSLTQKLNWNVRAARQQSFLKPSKSHAHLVRLENVAEMQLLTKSSHETSTDKQEKQEQKKNINKITNNDS